MLSSYKNFKKFAVGNKKLRILCDDEIKKIQCILLDMMDDIDTICRRENLVYFICGGTAIGAVRNGGYIPWDEDLDLCMPRQDYDRLAVLINEEMSSKYWVQNINLDRQYDLNFMKIRKKGTKYEEIFESEIDKAGLFIDIFPIENTYNNPIRRSVHGTGSYILLLITSCVRMNLKYKRLMCYVSDNTQMTRMVKIKSFIGKIFSFIPLYKWLTITEKWLSKCNDKTSRYVTIPSGRGHFWGELYERNKFFPAKDINFETRRYMIMREPDHYLSKLDGDYMTVPPIEKRERHTVVNIQID